MNFEKVEILTGISVDVHRGAIQLGKRISYLEDGNEVFRKHDSFEINIDNEHLIVSESKLVRDVWNVVSASCAETGFNNILDP